MKAVYPSKIWFNWAELIGLALKLPTELGLIFTHQTWSESSRPLSFYGRRAKSSSSGERIIRCQTDEGLVTLYNLPVPLTWRACYTELGVGERTFSFFFSYSSRVLFGKHRIVHPQGAKAGRPQRTGWENSLLAGQITCIFITSGSHILLWAPQICNSIHWSKLVNKD